MNEKSKIIVSFSSSIAVLIMAGIYSLINMNNYKKANEWVSHTESIIVLVWNSLLDIQNSESEKRAYVITGADNYLESFQNNLPKIKDSYFILKDKTKDNYASTLLDSLYRVIIIKNNWSVEVCSIRKRQGLESATKMILAGVGKSLMNNIKNISEKIIKREEKLLKERLEKASKQLLFTQIIIIISMFLAIIIVLFALYFFVSDYNKRMLVEKKLIEANQMANQSVILKDSFLANMSHEIRTPMNAIIGFTDLLAQSTLDENQEEYVSSVKLAGNNLLAIINDILDFSKIESGNTTIEYVPFSLKDALKNIYNLLNVRAKEKNLEYNFFLDASLPDFVIGDNVRLNQIMVNLIGNAIKFTEEGSITVSVKKIEEDDIYYKIKFIVKDTGIGISADKMDLIFDRFSQANIETTRKFGGTGLGLSIAKSLVELQGGEINLKSELGSGSEFSFEIQYKKFDKLALEPLEKPLAPKKPLGPVKILLCEDNLLNQRLASKVFIKFGFDFEIAENGRIGLEKLINQKFDLILMDLQMPEMDGYQTTIAIRNELKLQIPIVAMTAHSLVGEKEKCIKIGMNDYVGKPFTQDDLYNKICSNLIEKKQYYPLPDKIIERGDLNKDSDLINLNYLKELSDGNKEFEKEMIELFINQVPVDISDLDVAFGNSDAFRVKSLSHKLKSSMSVVGLSVLSPHLSFIEKNASNKEMNESLLEKFIYIKNTLNESYPLLHKKLKEEY